MNLPCFGQRTRMWPSSTTQAVPAMCTRSSPRVIRRSPPRGLHCRATNSVRPRRLPQYGARTVWADPVTGSSGIPFHGAKSEWQARRKGRHAHEIVKQRYEHVVVGQRVWAGECQSRRQKAKKRNGRSKNELRRIEDRMKAEEQRAE